MRNYQMRNRMIQLGYTAAKGALNYVDDSYIEPFVFSADTCRGSRTFVISPKETLEEYVRNQAFRELLDTGHYVYADGHICVNDPAYVVLRNGKLCLTEWANAHVDACCLRFVRSYYRDNRTRYVYGQLNSDEEYNGRSISLSMQSGSEDILLQARAMSKLLTELPATFEGTVRAHMKRLHISREKLAEQMSVSESSIRRLREERDDYSLDQIIAVCIGLHLPPEFSADLLKKAGRSLRDTPDHLIYKAILQTMYMKSLGEVQAMLKDYGCRTLNLRSTDEETEAREKKAK